MQTRSARAIEAVAATVCIALMVTGCSGSDLPNDPLRARICDEGFVIDQTLGEPSVSLAWVQFPHDFAYDTNVNGAQQRQISSGGVSSSRGTQQDTRGMRIICQRSVVSTQPSQQSREPTNSIRSRRPSTPAGSR